MQGVVERAEVGVDLLVEGARQEAEAFAGLDRGTGQDDAVDLLGLQRLHRLGHGQVGLAGARGADAEDDRVLVDRVDVPLLVEGLGSDGAAARGQDVLCQNLGRGLPAFTRPVLTCPQHGDRAFHCVLRHRLPGAEHQHHLVEQALDKGDFPWVADRADLVAPDVDVGRRESRLDHAQEGVSGSQHGHHGVLGGNGELCSRLALRGRVSCRCLSHRPARRPLRPPGYVSPATRAAWRFKGTPGG